MQSALHILFLQVKAQMQTLLSLGIRVLLLRFLPSLLFNFYLMTDLQTAKASKTLKKNILKRLLRHLLPQLVAQLMIFLLLPIPVQKLFLHLIFLQVKEKILYQENILLNNGGLKYEKLYNYRKRYSL